VLLRDRLSTFNTQQAVWLCFPGMMSLLVKIKEVIMRTFKHFIPTIFLFLMFLNVQIDLIILRDTTSNLL